MQNKNVLNGKGNNLELENLHGAITKVYVSGVISILNSLEASEVAKEEYAQDVVESGSENFMERPRDYVLGKDELALLKQAQGFLKENDIQVDVVQKSGSRVLRGKLSKQLKEKRSELGGYNG